MKTDYLKTMNFKEALEHTKELLQDRTKDFDERYEISEEFCKYYPYFDSCKFDKYFYEDL